MFRKFIIFLFHYHRERAIYLHDKYNLHYWIEEKNEKTNRKLK